MCGLQGLPAGALIFTQDGELPVDHLVPGDRIITRDSGYATLQALETARAETDLVRIRRGALGHNRPPRDTLLPAAQRLLLRDWRARALYGRTQALVPVAQLVDGEFVTRAGRGVLRLFTLRFARTHVIYADGLELASGAAMTAEA
ncbi:MAG: Hint domain-containing protein [Paracoccaceae bacterium]